MRWTEFLLPTLKEIPSEAEAISHILMIRAGLIRRLTSGVYSYLPLGLRVLKKVEKIIRQEMDSKQAQEVLLPAIQPIELWIKSGRFAALGEDMITFTDRHKKVNVLGPTHEEVITALVKNEVNSYRQLPLILYQIQTKFRDEARPRFGVMRSREFIMKDAYSFDCDGEGLNTSYNKMYQAYCRIFKRCGLNFIAVEADTGIMGGDVSHEFMVLAENGEDMVVICENCKYAVSMDKAECVKPVTRGQEPVARKMEEVKTPGVSSVEDVARFLKVGAEQLVKTLIYIADDKPVAVLVRGDHEINETKLNRLLKAGSLSMADEETIQKVTGGPLGFSGPVGLSGLKIIADLGIAASSNFVVGANKSDVHFVGVNIERDFKVWQWADVRNIMDKDICPKCMQPIKIEQAIEVGHVFKLGTKYTENLNATFLDEQGKAKKIIMGCYGIGVTRLIAACIEQNCDKNGIIWPKEIAPFQVILMPLNTAHVLSMDFARTIYGHLTERNIEVLLDDRDIRAGIKFKDADLIGIPLQIIIGEKNLEQNRIEIKERMTGQRYIIALDEALKKTIELLKIPG
ncbi:MAG: proline--tRNA ligase [Candidatus Omnitrophica bacterium]|nr:proline--tRNA ligase [Candidatus Omnitrophota bacterium]